MSYNNSRNYNTRNSGRFNRPGTFVPASSTNHQTYEVQAAPPLPPPPVAESQAPLTPMRQHPAPPTPKRQPSAPPTPMRQPPVPLQDLELQQEPKPQDSSIIKDEDADMSAEPSEDGTTNSSRHPFKFKLSGVKKISNKERRRRQNALLRRLTSPKNALMCINEMLPNEQIANQFRVQPAPLPKNNYFNQYPTMHNFYAELALDGNTYKGYGETKLAARNVAAEQAIRDIVLKKMQRFSEQGGAFAQGGGGGGAASGEEVGAVERAVDAMLEDEGEGEALPMIQLLSFALHKLFAEWEGAGHRVPQLRARNTAQVPVTEEDESMSSAPAPAPGAGKPKEPRKVPDNASSMHPAVLLTMMRPQCAFRELNAEGDRPQNMIFTFAVDVDDETYIGRAPNKKEARKCAARAACKAILGITFDDELGPERSEQ